MCRKPIVIVFCVLLLGPAWSAFAGLDPDLIVYWPFDEMAGTVAGDLTANGNDGTISAGPTWVAGYLDGALSFAGTGDVRGPYIPLDNRTFTIAMWVSPSLTSSQIVFSEVQTGSTNLSMHFRLGGTGSTDAPVNGIRFGFYSNDTDSPANILTPNTWAHITFYYDYEARVRRIYLNGEQVAQQTSVSPYLGTSGPICVGSWTGSSYYTGMVDDFQLWHKALSEAEIQRIMAGLGDTSIAADPVPEDEATDVVRDIVLGWLPGEYAATHDVYFGTVFDDVNDATQPIETAADAAYDPDGLLEYGQTYYWRIDEVNGAPDYTTFKGETWSFTVEPYAYPITNLTATASAEQGTSPAIRTIDGSGLDEFDQHSIEMNDMWMTPGGLPAWIQFDFDKVYKLNELWVWNANSQLEGFMGFGAMDVAIEYSSDGETWTPLENVPQFAQGTGQATYVANTIVDMAGVMAQHVKLTINDNWGAAAIVSLSEVRFFYTPVQAFEPDPADGATDVDLEATLNWRPGREAVSHDVYFGADANAVADETVAAETVTDHSYMPPTMDFGTMYYWKVNEVGDAETYAGELWSFMAQEFEPIDDFESYDDNIPAETTIWHIWIDGLTDNASGSQVGYNDAASGTFGETGIVHGGRQSMPLQYDNTSFAFSEATQTFDSAQDWTASTANTLSLYYRGVAPGFEETPSGTILMNGTGADIWGTSDAFRFAYKSLNGNGSMVARVMSIANTNVWAKGGVMIRQSTDAGSTHAFMPITPGGAGGGNGASFQRRLTAGGDSANSDSATVVAAPYWVKIERVGNNFSGYISPDGVTWTQLGEAQTIVMSDPVLIGLALCSHEAALTTSAEFSDISATGNVTGAWQVTGIGLEQVEGNSIESMYLTVKDTSGNSETMVNPDTLATAQMSWQQWTIPLSDFTSAGVKMNAVKSITIGVGDKTGSPSGGSGILYVDDIAYGRSAQ